MPNFRAAFNKSENISFQPWGLGGYNRIHAKGWQIKTLKEAMTALGDSEVQYHYILFSYNILSPGIKMVFFVHLKWTIITFGKPSIPYQYQ